MLGNAKDHYAVLGVYHTATHEEIKRAYHALSRKIHPDKKKETTVANKANTLEFHQLSIAWEVLGNPARRREYDQMMSSERNRSRGVVQGKVDLDDMKEDDEGYSYPCWCSGRYVIKESDLEAGRDMAPCSDCSLKIQVLFDVVPSDEEPDNSG